MKLKKLIAAIFFSIVLAVSSVDSRSSLSVNRPPIIYQIKRTPNYTKRKKQLSVPGFAIRNNL